MDIDYDAIVDSGTSHKFVSQAVFDYLQKLQKGSTASEVCLGGLEKLHVNFVDCTQTDSHQGAIIKVQLESGQLTHVEFNVVEMLCGEMILGMPFLVATNPTIDWQAHTL